MSAAGRPNAIARAIRRARSLHRDEGGQSMAFVAVTIFLVICFVVVLLNNGRNINHKVEAQNAADAAAVSAATWQARGMNLVAMGNILQSMIAAESVMVEAVNWATFSTLAQAAANASCYCDPWCDFDLGKCIQSIEETINMVIQLVDIIGAGWLEDEQDYLWGRAEDISDMEASIRDAVRGLSAGEARAVAEANGMDFGFSWPADMPVQEGDVEDLCPTMMYGDDGGYEGWGALNYGLIAATLSYAITEYESEAFGPAFATHPGLWQGGPIGSATQTLPFEMLFGEEAPLAMGNMWWHLWVLFVEANLCNGWNIFLGIDSSDLDKAKPLILSDDFFEKDRYFLGFGYDQPESGKEVAVPQHFENTYNEWIGLVTVAQAEVYNTYEGYADDEQLMFIPQWRSRLVPIDQLGELPWELFSYLYDVYDVNLPDPIMVTRLSGWSTVLSDVTNSVVAH
ncbi:pilus assembly protein TadG-related protein [Myxococcota bacterium]|nr:pilus assembly protein TadG-related protein [Myxococcota bacterium]